MADLTQKDWNNGYTAVRKCNYFLKNYHRVTNITPNVEHYIGEGYFFRAEAYFGLLKNFGGVPLITDVLNVSSEELYKERSTREEIAKFIIQDLDSAIHYLHLKNKGACKPGRVNKQAALTMKARVALYEGTWEYYHGRKGTDYAVAGKDGEAFLQDVVEAVDDLIEIEGTNIFTDGGIYDEHTISYRHKMICRKWRGFFITLFIVRSCSINRTICMKQSQAMDSVIHADLLICIWTRMESHVSCRHIH